MGRYAGSKDERVVFHISVVFKRQGNVSIESNFRIKTNIAVENLRLLKISIFILNLMIVNVFRKEML